MLRIALSRMTVGVLAVVLFSAPLGAGEPLVGNPFDGEDDVVLHDHAQRGGVVAIAGERFDATTFTRTALLAVFSERTGELLWTDENGALGFESVAVAQGRVCAAGVSGGTGPAELNIRCYGAKDGALLWGKTFDPPAGPMGSPLFIVLDRDSLSLSGKALIVRSSNGSANFGGGSFAVILDAGTGLAK